MPQPLKAGLPPNLDLTGNFVVRMTALDPTTGAVVSGVTVSAFTMMVVNLGGGTIPDQPGFTVTPLLQYTGGVT